MDAMTKKQLQIIATKIRMAVIEGTFNAKSGHPGDSLSATDTLAHLYFNEMNVDPANPRGRVGTVLYCPRDTPPPPCTVRWLTAASSP